MNNQQDTFRSSIYQMLFSYLLRCICYVVGHSLNPNQMKRLSFITNNFINHDIISFNSLLKNECKNPFSTMESDNRIKKRTRRVENTTTSNKSSTKESSYTKIIDPESDESSFDYKTMYYDLMIVKNNQEEEVVRLLKREKELIEDKTYWKNKYLKMVNNSQIVKNKDQTIFMQNVTMNGSVVNSKDDVPIFNSPDVDVSVNKVNNQTYNQTYDNQQHHKTVNDNKTINTTKIINKDDKQLKADLKNIIFQEFEKLTVNNVTYKNKNLGAGSSEGAQFTTKSSIPHYQAEKIKKLQEIISDIQQDEKSVISTLTYNQTKFYHFINGFIVNDSIRWEDLGNIYSWVDKFKNEFLSHLFDEKMNPDISHFTSSVLNAKKKYTHVELKLIVLSIDDVYLNFFQGHNLHNCFFNFLKLALEARLLDSYKKSLLIKQFIISNKSYFSYYVDSCFMSNIEIFKYNRDIEVPKEIQKQALPYTELPSDFSMKVDLNHSDIWCENHEFGEYDFNYEHGHNLPFRYDISKNK